MGIQAELTKRVQKIIEEKNLFINDDGKILWNNNPIAKIKKGENYLSPEIDIIADDALPLENKNELRIFVEKWLQNYIEEDLKDLINLTKIKIEHQYLRALAYQLYENNGVLKRKEVDEIIKKISKEDRKKLWQMGIKIGRYHIFLPRMFKPKSVTLRTILWKIYYEIDSKIEIPKFGLNFFESKNLNEKFLLLCGFEKFKNFFVRIDILEKLFLNIINKTENKQFKVSAEMMNLLGCTKDNFYKFITLMNYKKAKEDNVYYFTGDIKKNNKKIVKKIGRAHV